MRVWLRHKRIGSALVGVALLAACSTSPTPTRPLSRPSPPAPTAEARDRPGARHRAGRSGSGPAAVRRTAPGAGAAGWTLSVWARVPKARLAAWAPDGSLLISVPSYRAGGARLAPSGAGPRESVPLDGLDQPHGLAFAGNTLYVAESDQVDAYDYADGAATNRRTVAADLPDAKSPDLRGAYAHALKSVAVGPDGAVYFSIGSTGNISADDRDGDSAARDHHAGPARRRSGATVCDRRAQRHRAGDRAATVRCGRRSTIATTSPTRRPARSPWTTSTTIRPRRSPG